MSESILVEGHWEHANWAVVFVFSFLFAFVSVFLSSYVSLCDVVFAVFPCLKVFWWKAIGSMQMGELGDSYDPLENKGPHCIHTFSSPSQKC